MLVNADELWRALARTDELPAESIERSLENWDQVSDRFLAKLRAQAAGAKLSDADLNALFYAIHMFAEKRDQRAYAPLCAELAKDMDEDSWLGDAVTETLPSVLINLFDGDPGLLQTVAEAPNADVFARSAALEAFGFLTRAGGLIPEEAARDYLTGYGKALTDAEDPYLGRGWALTVAALGFDDLGPEVARAISRGAVDPDFYSIKDFHADIAEARADPEGLAVFLREGIEPFGSTVETFSALILSPENELRDLGDDFGSEDLGAPEAPHVNPFRDVGRNDACPCGSGKKYKKCCLAA